MGLNLSNRQIAAELGLGTSNVQAMTEQLRGGLVAKAPAVTLQGEVEADEVYVVAGHKGQPEDVAKSGGLGPGRCRRLVGAPRPAPFAQARRGPAGARWRRTSHPSLA